MTLPKHLRDFQITFHMRGASVEVAAPINRDLFASYGAIREWCYWRRLPASFAKLVIDLYCYELRERHIVVDVLGICEVHCAVEANELLANYRNLRWLMDQMISAVRAVETSLAWDGTELVAYLDSLGAQNFPIVQPLLKWRTVSKRNRVVCLPWVQLEPGRYEAGADVLDLEGRRLNQVTILRSSKPIYVEDDFAISKTVVDGRQFRLLTKEGATLGLVPFDPI